MLYVLERSKSKKFKDKILMIVTVFYFFFPGENCKSLGLAEERD